VVGVFHRHGVFLFVVTVVTIVGVVAATAGVAGVVVVVVVAVVVCCVDRILFFFANLCDVSVLLDPAYLWEWVGLVLWLCCRKRKRNS
jgi:hypothetical protein